MSDATGVWLIGARGSVATTTLIGAAGVASGVVPSTGLVSEQDRFHDVGLPSMRDLVFGGHDVAETPLVKRAETLVSGGVVHREVVDAVQNELRDAESRLRPGVSTDDSEPPMETVARLRRDLDDFRQRHDLARVIVINVSSSEAAFAVPAEHASLDALRDGLNDGRALLPPSGLYSLAAFESGCPFIDFTPSIATTIPALAELASQVGVCFAGRDGKTGETLVKSVLAPMFAQRSLTVQSWYGTNLLGGGDGATLAEPGRAEGKLATKGGLVEDILGYPVEAPLHIDYVGDMGDWKTAWDHITFSGFGGIRMRMQFTWEGCDSALAAPLVVDLARFGALADKRGLHGVVDALGFFFKDPIGTKRHHLSAQYDHLCSWAHGDDGDGTADDGKTGDKVAS